MNLCRWICRCVLLLVGGALLVATYFPFNVSAQDFVPPDQALRVLIKEIEPFVFVDGSEVDGFSVDLWHALAREADLNYEFTVVETVEEQLDGVLDGSADAALGAISITQERETVIDFSFAYFQAGLGILVSKGRNPASPFLEALRIGQFTLPLLRLVLLLGVIIIVAGHVIWLLERRRNSDFPHAYLPGVWEGIWWASVTVTTVGYGDRTPRSQYGRFFALLWMFAGLFIIANFTATVTTQLTVQEIRRAIAAPQDLYGKRVATVDGTTADTWLGQAGIQSVGLESVDDAYELLETGRVDAVVYDHPVLRYYAANQGADRVEMVGPSFNEENYGIVFATGSPLREEVNRALLRLIETGEYDVIHRKWFGVDRGQ